jgi:type IV pilus assembly protein PilC
MAAQMKAFIWEARTRTGDVKKGVMEAETEEAVHNKLKMQQLSPVTVKKQPRQITLPTIGTGVSVNDIVIFTRLFATMIDAGLPIVQCLEILSSQAENKRFGKILAQIRTSVEGGLTLSDAMRRFPKIFDNLFVNLVAAGEAGGILDTILQRLSQYMEKAQKLAPPSEGRHELSAHRLVHRRHRRRRPAHQGHPGVREDVQGLRRRQVAQADPGGHRHVVRDAPLPALHRDRRVDPAVHGLEGMILRTRKGRLAWDGMLLKLPILGNVLRKTVVARFTRTMGTLLSSGVPILDAMEIVGKTAGNVVVQDGIMFVRARISEGKDMSTPLMETGLMPPMVVQMISVGEQTGALDAMLTKIADFYEEEVDVAVASMTSMIEPLMMVFLGTVVGGLVIAMYLPIFEMAGNIKS